MTDTIQFIGSLAPIQSAIKITGDGGGMRLIIDVPESELPNALPIVTMREQILEITIEVNHDRHEPDTNRTKLTY